MLQINRDPLSPVEVEQLRQVCGALAARCQSRLPALLGQPSCQLNRAARAAQEALSLMQRSMLGESPYFDRRVPVWFMDHGAANYPLSAEDLANDYYVAEHAPEQAEKLLQSAKRIDLTDSKLDMPEYHRCYLNHQIKLCAEVGYLGQRNLVKRDQFDRQMAVAITAHVANQIVREHGGLPERLELSEKVGNYLDDVYRCRQQLRISGLRPEGVMEFMSRLHDAHGPYASI